MRFSSAGPKKSLLKIGVALITVLFSCSSPSGSVESYTRGLKVRYSNGVNKVETIIHHGWGSDCPDTGNNLYQAECTPVTESPLDWAWGNNFNARWEGYIYIPRPGEYIFSAWVDGTVYITVNDSVVADFNTVGSAYSKTVNFIKADWYPVVMIFTANGGSNYMHLGWVKPGAAYETVPANNLGHE